MPRGCTRNPEDALLISAVNGHVSCGWEDVPLGHREVPQDLEEPAAPRKRAVGLLIDVWVIVTALC